jgi:hypothetical protein
MSSALRHANLEEIERRLRLHVERLAGLIGPRHLGAGGSLATAAAYVERELSEPVNELDRTSLG